MEESSNCGGTSTSLPPIPSLVRADFVCGSLSADCDFASLSIGQEVGHADRELGGDSGGYKGSHLVVSQVGADSAALQVTSSYNPDNVFGILNVSRAEGDNGNSRLLVEFEPAEKYDSLDLAYYLVWDWFLSDLPVSFSDPTALQRAIFETGSFPPDEGGQSAEEHLVFVAEPQP